MAIALTLNPTTLPGAYVGAPYAGFDFKSVLQVTGDPAYTGNGVAWVADGLPSGFTLDANGVLSGTGQAVGSSSVTVTASYKSQQASRAYSLDVSKPSANIGLSPAVNGKTVWNLDTDGPLVLSTAGAYTLTLSPGLPISIKAWGAAGGGGMDSATNCPSTKLGGAGGYAGGDYITQGSTFIAWVGGGGNHGTDATAPFGGGGKAVTAENNKIAGSGGGLSGLFLASATQQNAVLIAAGGGGGAEAAGGGAGQAGIDSAGNGAPGTAGTLIAGGAGGGGAYGAGNPGSALQGGSYAGNGYSGAGGGGGYFGGGSGGRNNYMGESGGGGSSYASTAVANAVVLTANYATPANSADADRGTAGQPGPAAPTGGSTTLCSGQPGKRIIFAR